MSALFCSFDVVRRSFLPAGSADQIFTVARTLFTHVSAFFFLLALPSFLSHDSFSGSGLLCSPDSAGEASRAPSHSPGGGGGRRGGKEGGRGRGQPTLFSLSAPVTCSAMWGEMQPGAQHLLLSAWWGKEEEEMCHVCYLIMRDYYLLICTITTTANVKTCRMYKILYCTYLFMTSMFPFFLFHFQTN